MLLDNNDPDDWLVAGLVVVGNALLLAWLVGGPTGTFFADALLFLLASIGASTAYIRWATSRSRARLAARGMQTRLVSVLGRCIEPMTRQRAIFQVGLGLIAIDLVASYGAFVVHNGMWTELCWMPVLGAIIAVVAAWDIANELRAETPVLARYHR
jgi:hypothetical protein